MMSSWQKLSSKIVYQCPYFQIAEDKVITPDGRQSIYYQSLSLGAVVTVALDENQNVYFIKEDKYLTREILTLPAGAIEKGENTLKCAQRELKEEVGLRAQTWQDLGYFWSSPGLSNQKGWVFLARDLSSGKQQPEGSEKIEVIKIPFNQALQLIKEEKITDSWAITPLFKTKLFLSL